MRKLPQLATQNIVARKCCPYYLVFKASESAFDSVVSVTSTMMTQTLFQLARFVCTFLLVLFLWGHTRRQYRHRRTKRRAWSHAGERRRGSTPWGWGWWRRTTTGRGRGRRWTTRERWVGEVAGDHHHQGKVVGVVVGDHPHQGKGEGVVGGGAGPPWRGWGSRGTTWKVKRGFVRNKGISFISKLSWINAKNWLQYPFWKWQSYIMSSPWHYEHLFVSVQFIQKKFPWADTLGKQKQCLQLGVKQGFVKAPTKN